MSIKVAYKVLDSPYALEMELNHWAGEGWLLDQTAGNLLILVKTFVVDDDSAAGREPATPDESPQPTSVETPPKRHWAELFPPGTTAEDTAEAIAGAIEVHQPPKPPWTARFEGRLCRFEMALHEVLMYAALLKDEDWPAISDGRLGDLRILRRDAISALQELAPYLFLGPQDRH